MRIFLAIESAEIFYHYKSVVAALCSRGHAVKIFFAKGTNPANLRPANSMDVVKEFAGQWKNFEYGGEPYRANFMRRSVLFPARAVANYRRFLIAASTPPFYAERYRKLLPGWFKLFVSFPILNVKWFIRSGFCDRIISFIEHSFPSDKTLTRNITGFKPDVILVSTGNVVSSSPDFEYLRAARALGIPNALLVASWDYLETKGLIHVVPDALLVWNNTHRAEAVAAHGIPAERIRLVGAPLFDNFFSNLRLSERRQSFCRKYGLRPEDPIILYIGSSGIFGSEAQFLQSVRRALDEAEDARIRKAQIIVRPHPISRGSRNFKKMAAGLRDVTLIPEWGELPSTAGALQLFYDTLCHSALVVSIASSGLINALIAGKPAATVLVDCYSQIQSQAPHFVHLLKSGAIYAAEDFREVPRVLSAVLSGSGDAKSQRELFIKNYIRPQDFARSAGEMVADELEKLAVHI